MIKYVIIFVVLILLIAVAVRVRTRTFGTFYIDDSNPDKDVIRIEYERYAEYIKDGKFIIFKVKRGAHLDGEAKML